MINIIEELSNSIEEITKIIIDIINLKEVIHIIIIESESIIKEIVNIKKDNANSNCKK